MIRNMEKKQNMSNVDELCVKYVFDELDPSEVTLVEKAMISDQNLLIEVESLRSTWKKLQNLPELEPPPNISEAIIHQAIDYANQQQFFGNHWKNPGLLATAAIVLFSLLISTAYLLPSDAVTGEQSQESRISASVGSDAVSVPDGALKFNQDPFRIWNGYTNMVFIGGVGEQQDQSIPDTLQQGMIPLETGSNPFLISPALRDFQLTGTNY